MGFFKKIFGGHDDDGTQEPRKPRQPQAVDGFMLPDLGEGETKRLLKDALAQLPTSGNVVRFEANSVVTDYPSNDAIQTDTDTFDEVLHVSVNRQQEQLDLLDDPEQRTPYTLRVLLAQDQPAGNFLRWYECLPTDNYRNSPCVELDVFDGQGTTTASRVIVERDGPAYTLHAAAVVWVHHSWHTEVTLYVTVAARIEHIRV